MSLQIGSPQLLWDLDDCATTLGIAADLIGKGKDAEAADALRLLVHSANEALAKVTNPEYMATAFGRDGEKIE